MMQKFCMLKKLDAEILHDLIFRLIYNFSYNNCMMQKFCMLKKLDAEILHDLSFRVIHYFFYNNSASHRAQNNGRSTDIVRPRYR